MAKHSRKSIRREDRLVRRLFPADPLHLLNNRPTAYIFMRKIRGMSEFICEEECSVYDERLMENPDEWAFSAATGQARAIFKAEAATKQKHRIRHEPEPDAPSHTVIIGLDTYNKCAALARHAKPDLTRITPLVSRD